MNHKKMKYRLGAILLALILLALPACNNCIVIYEESESLEIPEGDTLVLLDSSPTTLDPALSQEITSHTYVTQIFSGLVTLDRDMNIVPDIAENWETSADGKTYTFQLRRGVLFHDGKEVSAEDFKYSWERTCDPDTRSTTADTYLGDIAGSEEMLSGNAGEMAGVEVIDELTLRVTLTSPSTAFLSKLTYPAAFVVDRENVDSGAEWWRKPNGTGPFKLKGWDEDELLLLERNNDYYRDKAGVSYIAFRLSGGTSMQLYENGDIDVTYVSLSNLDRVQDENNPLNTELSIFPELSLSFIGFNTSEPPFDDPDVRRAFCYALDKDRVINQVLGDSVNRADVIVPEGMPGYIGGVTGLSYDLDKAKKLLKGKDLTTITFTTPGLGGYLSSSLTATLWQWHQNLNVDIEVRQLESDTYFSRLDKEKDDIFFYGWVADYADPQNFLQVLFDSSSENNDSEYHNDQVDNLLEQAAMEQDGETRFELYYKAEQMIIDDAACLPLWFGRNYILVKPYVENFIISPLGIPLLSQVSLSE